MLTSAYETDLTFGPARPSPSRGPGRQDQNLILLMAERYSRSSAAMSDWSARAKKSVDYFEGLQWSREDLALLAAEGRPALVINKIKPLVNLVWGYQSTNLTDITYVPGHDGTGTAETANALNVLSKQIAELNSIKHVDAEVFLDGLLTGRGYFDWRLDFQDNMLGEIRVRSEDPFATYLDPDGKDYDLNTGNYAIVSRWISIDEIEYYYGRDAATLVTPWITGGNFSGVPMGLYDGYEEITPWRRFGGEESVETKSWYGAYSGFWDWVDTARKSIRMIDVQHYVRAHQWHFVDLQTGDAVPIRESWSADRVRRVLELARSRGEEMIIQNRQVRRLRQTQMVGDVVVYDQWSPYRSMTLVPFFPYFRRGKTKGMVEDLTDSQDEINKRRSNFMNILGRASSGGWMVDKNTVDARERSNLEINGSAPGFTLFYDSKNGRYPKPEQIGPPPVPSGYSDLERAADDDMKDIAGINEAALGQIEAANASGHAVESRQRQSIVGQEPTMLSFNRTKTLCGRKQLQLVQGHYTEERVIRTQGDRFDDPRSAVINQATADGIINNVTIGRYAMKVDERPLSSTWLDAQFEEVMRIKETGVPIPDEFIVDASSLGRKEELKAALAEARAAEAAMAEAGVDPKTGGAVPRAGAGDAAGPAETEIGAPPESLVPLAAE